MIMVLTNAKCYQRCPRAAREMKSFKVQISNTIRSIGNIRRPGLERHAMHFDSFKLKNMVKKMPRVA